MLSGLSGGQIPRGAERKLEPWLTLGKLQNETEGTFVAGHWTGFGIKNSIPTPNSVTFTAESKQDWSRLYGMRLEILLVEGRSFNGEVIVHTTKREAKSSYRTTAQVSSTAKFSLIGTNKHQIVDLPFSAFDKFSPFGETFREIKKVEIRGSFADGKDGKINVPRVDVIAAPILKLFSEARSLAGDKNADLNYELKVMNCTNRSQSVNLAHHPYSKHVMTASIKPDQITLKPGEIKSANIIVNVTDRVPPGGRERQKIIALANGQLGGEIELNHCPKTAPSIPRTHPRTLARGA